jgi:hypothetical protein
VKIHTGVAKIAIAGEGEIPQGVGERLHVKSFQGDGENCQISILLLWSKF